MTSSPAPQGDTGAKSEKQAQQQQQQQQPSHYPFYSLDENDPDPQGGLLANPDDVDLPFLFWDLDNESGTPAAANYTQVLAPSPPNSNQVCTIPLQQQQQQQQQQTQPQTLTAQPASQSFNPFNPAQTQSFNPFNP